MPPNGEAVIVVFQSVEDVAISTQTSEGNSEDFSTVSATGPFRAGCRGG